MKLHVYAERQATPPLWEAVFLHKPNDKGKFDLWTVDMGECPALSALLTGCPYGALANKPALFDQIVQPDYAPEHVTKPIQAVLKQYDGTIQGLTWLRASRLEAPEFLALDAMRSDGTPVKVHLILKPLVDVLHREMAELGLLDNIALVLFLAPT